MLSFSGSLVHVDMYSCTAMCDYHIYKITNVRPSVTERLPVISGNNSNTSLYSAILKAERLGPAPARALGLLLR